MKDWIKSHIDINDLVDAYYFLYKLGDYCTACFRENEHREEYVREKAIEVFMGTNKAYSKLDKLKLSIEEKNI